MSKVITVRYNSCVKKIIFSTIVFIAVVFVILRFVPTVLNQYLGLETKAGIKVLSQPQDSKVFINNEEVGKTPYENEQLSAGEYTLKLQNNDFLWEGRVKLNAGTLSIINRDLAKDPASSAGETLTLEKGKGVTIVSTPVGAEIEIDGKYYGKTPVSLDLQSAEHTININQANYLKRSIRAYVPNNYKLVINVDLSISEADLTAINTTPIIETQEVLIKNTPTGFLRVRDKPSLNGAEIGRVKPGEKLVLLEELSGWVRIRLPDLKEGYVSSSYIEKVNQAPR